MDKVDMRGLAALHRGVFSKFGTEEQVALLIEGIRKRDVWELDKGAICVIDEIEWLYGDDKIGFRRALREKSVS